MATQRKTMRPPSRPFSAEDDELLRHLWNDGLPTMEIAAQLGRSKNSIIGRSHRMNLPARPSPIRYGGVKQVAVKERKPNYILIALRGEGPVRVAPKPAFIAPPPMRQAPIPGSMAGGCRWPMWNDKQRPTQRFCGDARRGHLPYCHDHCAVAYAPPRGQVNKPNQIARR